MVIIILAAVIGAGLTGLGIKFWLDSRQSPEEITWPEFWIGMAIAAFVLAPLVAYVGWKTARSNLVTYNEYLNGWEAAAIKEDIPCERDGSCSHDYDCDPYLVPETYSCNCTTDSKGHESCSTCVRMVTKYHSCPYVTVESNYTVDTTLGSYSIDSHRFPANPQAHRWRDSEAVPDSVIERAGVGAPPFWQAVHDRIAKGRPGPASKRSSYNNYILASERTILKQYSAEVARFQKAGLLPVLNSGIHDLYLADKTYFVGFNPKDSPRWHERMRYLDAALGSERQGDAHLILVQNQAINANPDAYVSALRAYWQSTELLGKDAFSKNGIGIVVGTVDGQTVAWSRAFTGMPIGNEYLQVVMRSSMKGLPFTPEAVIGSVERSLDGGRAHTLHDHGALETALWGLVDKQTKFVRVSMSGRGKTGAGYLYLMGEIQPTQSQKTWIAIITFFVCCLVWVAVAFIGQRANAYRSQRNYYDRY
jgi:hypothetical protein